MKANLIATIEVADKPRPPRVLHHENGDEEIIYTVTQDTMDELIIKLIENEQNG